MVKSQGYDTVMVDYFGMAFIGGDGDPETVALDFARAVDKFNEENGTRLIFGWGE